MNTKKWNTLYINAAIATCESQQQPYGFIPAGALAVSQGMIDWVGSMQELPENYVALAAEIYDVKGRVITPTLIDCHTHLVFGGNRCREFEMRLRGKSYEEIARAGGGIRSTVMATRAASEDVLLQAALKRAQALLAEGVTIIEIKSGYGLDLATELKILRVAKKIGEQLPLKICATFLGAHALPPEFAGRADDFIGHVCQEMIPVVAKEKLATAVDVFCETIAFSLAQTERVFKAAQEYGLAVKCHAEQLSNSGSAALAAKYQALSVDHLEFLSEKSVVALSESNTVAVLLPGAFYFLREKQLPPIELLRQYHVPMAIATDCNPGTSPTTSLLLMLNMACTLFRLTPEEALLGVTRYAAQALGLDDQYGTLAVGKKASFVIWDIDHPAELAYTFGYNPCLKVLSP